MVSLDGKKTMQHSQGKSYAELARKRLKSLCVNYLDEFIPVNGTTTKSYLCPIIFFFTEIILVKAFGENFAMHYYFGIN